MRFVNSLVNALGDLLLSPFERLSAWPALIAASLCTTVAFLALFKCCSDQSAIRRKKGRVISRVLELILYQHDFVVSLTACGRIFVENLSYLYEFMKPLLVGAIPCAFLLIQLGCWFDWRPFREGETVLIEVHLREGTPLPLPAASLAVSDSLLVETEGLRIPSNHEIDWRVRARHAGRGWADVSIAGVTERKQIEVGDRLQKVSASRAGAGFWDELAHPAEPALDSSGPIRRIDVRYPARLMYLFDYEADWLLAFVVLTIVFSLLLKRAFRVTF